MKYEVELEKNSFAVKGTLDMVATGRLDVEQAERIVNIWIESTAKKFYNEGALDGLRRKCKTCHERGEKVSVSGLNE